MYRNTPETRHCSFLFVEGNSDEKFWGGRISETRCCIVFMVSFQKNNERKTGKNAVIANIRSLNNSNAFIDGFLGIVDADYDHLLSYVPENNICVTDTRDLETLLLRSTTVFKKMLAEFGDSQLINDFENKINKSVQDYLLELALLFAQIEWLKLNSLPDLDLKDLHKNESIVNRDQWQIDKAKLYIFVKNKGINSELPQFQLLLKTIENINPWLLCNGHTMTELLGIGFQNGILGKNKKATAENISSYLRAAIEQNDLYQSCLCQSIFNWQNRHSLYEILI
jgi:hypothetical protein